MKSIEGSIDLALSYLRLAQDVVEEAIDMAVEDVRFSSQGAGGLFFPALLSARAKAGELIFDLEYRLPRLSKEEEERGKR